MGRNNDSTVIHRNDGKFEESEVHVDDDDYVEEEEDGIDTAAMEQIHRRDEVGEVRKMSSKDTHVYVYGVSW